MKYTLASVANIAAILIGLVMLFGWLDDQCLTQDRRDMQTLHPTWETPQIEAESRIVHKSHQYHGGGGQY